MNHLWNRRRTVLGAVAGMLLLGGVYVMLASKTYTSTATLYIDQMRPGVIGETPGDWQRSDNYLYTQCQLMTATPILSMALAQKGIAGLDTLRGVADPIAYLRKRVSADVGKNNDIVSVSMDSPNAVECSKLVNAIVRAYVAYQGKTQHSTSAEMLELLQKEKARDEAAIAGKDANLAALRDKAGAMAYDTPQNNPLMQQETALSNALTAARLDAISAEAAYQQALAMVQNDPEKMKQIEQPDSAGDLVAASGPQLELVKAEIFRLAQSLKDMQHIYLPDHPLVVQTRSRLEQLTVTYVRAQRQHWLTAQGQEKVLEASFDQQHKLVLQQATQGADLDRIKTELSRIEKDLDLVEERINTVSVNQDAGGLNINVLDPATPNWVPSHPNKKKVFTASLLMGLVLGGVMAVGREKLELRKRIKHPAAHLGVPLLGVLPSMEGVGASAMRALQAHLDPAGTVAESARGIARAMTRAGLDEESGRTLLVTSTNPLDGRTTLACNLAIAMAQSGLRVLLVDANSRGPRLHHIFKAPSTRGFYDLLAGSTSGLPAIHNTMVDGVDVMPCGTPPAETTERFDDASLVDVLGELSDQYDRVIVDSPPLSRGVEPRILAASCAAVILVTPTRATARRHMEQGLRLLQGAQVNVLGVVLNDLGSIDPLKLIGEEISPARHVLSVSKVRAFQPAAYAVGPKD